MMSFTCALLKGKEVAKDYTCILEDIFFLSVCQTIAYCNICFYSNPFGEVLAEMSKGILFVCHLFNV